MANRRVCVDVLQVGLYNGAESSVNYRNRSQNQEEVSPNCSSGRHQIHRNAETSVTSQLHQYAGVEHTYRRGGRSVTVGAPCMEREQSSQYAESEEYSREENTLDFCRDVFVCYFENVHRFSSGSVIDTQDTDKQESRTTHQHQCKFHCGIFLASATPNADKQIHRDKGNLVEHEHGEQVGRNKETEHTGTQ